MEKMVRRYWPVVLFLSLEVLAYGILQTVPHPPERYPYYVGVTCSAAALVLFVWKTDNVMTGWRKPFSYLIGLLTLGAPAVLWEGGCPRWWPVLCIVVSSVMLVVSIHIHGHRQELGRALGERIARGKHGVAHLPWSTDGGDEGSKK